MDVDNAACAVSAAGPLPMSAVRRCQRPAVDRIIRAPCRIAGMANTRNVHEPIAPEIE